MEQKRFNLQETRSEHKDYVKSPESFIELRKNNANKINEALKLFYEENNSEQLNSLIESKDLDINKIAHFAAKAFEGQKRKDNSYLATHSLGLYINARELGISEKDVLATALLHDVAEDTNYDLKDIRKLFGDHWANLATIMTEKRGEFSRDADLVRFVEQLKRGGKIVLETEILDRMDDIADMGYLTDKLDAQDISEEVKEEIREKIAKKLAKNKFTIDTLLQEVEQAPATSELFYKLYSYQRKTLEIPKKSIDRYLRIYKEIHYTQSLNKPRELPQSVNTEEYQGKVYLTISGSRPSRSGNYENFYLRDRDMKPIKAVYGKRSRSGSSNIMKYTVHDGDWLIQDYKNGIGDTAREIVRMRIFLRFDKSKVTAETRDPEVLFMGGPDAPIPKNVADILDPTSESISRPAEAIRRERPNLQSLLDASEHGDFSKDALEKVLDHVPTENGDTLASWLMRAEREMRNQQGLFEQLYKESISNYYPRKWKPEDYPASLSPNDFKGHEDEAMHLLELVPYDPSKYYYFHVGKRNQQIFSDFIGQWLYECQALGLIGVFENSDLHRAYTKE